MMKRALLSLLVLVLGAGAVGSSPTEVTVLSAYTPYTLARALPCKVHSTTPNVNCPDASLALSLAATEAVSLGVTLTIDQDYAAASEFQIPSGLTVYFVPGKCIVQQFSPGNTQGVIGNANYTVQISGVTAYNMKVCGDPTHTLGGSAYRFNVANSQVWYPTVDYATGRAFTVIMANSQVYGPTFYNPLPQTGSGAFRIEGCSDSQVIGGYGVSGDGTWQFSAPINGTVPNQSIVRCWLNGVGGYSYDGGFFSAELHIEGQSQNMLGSVWPTNTAGVGTGHSVGDLLNCTGGTPSTVCQIRITAVNAGAATQAIVSNPGSYSGTLPNPVTMSDGSTWNVTWPSAYQGTSCIIDSGIIGSPGQALSGRGITIGNEGSNGAQCGRPAIDNLTVAHLTLDDSADQQSAQVIEVDGGDFAHPVGKVTLDDVTVPSPFAVCLDVSGPVMDLVAEHLKCGPSHQGLLGTLSQTAVAGTLTLSVSPAICDVVKNGDTLAVTLDNNTLLNGSYAGKQLIAPAVGDCAAGTITFTSMLGTASAGLAQLRDYSEQVFTTVADTPPGSFAVSVQVGTKFGIGDSVILACGDGTADQTTVASVTSGNKSQTVTLNAACSADTPAGALFANRSNNSAHAVVTTEGVRGATFNQPVLYGADAALFSLGSLNGSSVPSADVAINDAQLRDVGNANPAINLSNCAHCVTRGGAVYGVAGTGSANAASYSTSVPSGTDNLAVAVTSGTTVFNTENPGLFAWTKPFYAKIDSEIVYVQRGMGTPVWTVSRAMLGTTAASHSVGAAITLAQSGVTDSPLIGLDIGDLGYTDPSSAIAHYQPGQGNAPQNLLGVNGERTSINQGGTSTPLAFTDEFPQINLTGIGTINSVTFSTTMPPFKTNCARWWNKNSGPNIPVTNGTGIHNTGAATFSLTNGGYGTWCFDPSLQALYQQSGSAN